MTELLKIIGIGLAGGAVAVTVRKYNSTYGMLTALALGAFMLVSVCDMLSGIVHRLYDITSVGSLDKEYVSVIMKVIGIAYVSQFGAQTLRDSGESAVASKCELAGKVFILYLSLPVVEDFLRLCVGLTEGI